MPTLPRTSRLLPLLAMFLLLGMALSSSVVQAEKDEVVYFNTESLKYHCMTCRWAVKCTKNCVRMKKSQAEEKGTPCKVCHGSCGE